MPKKEITVYASPEKLATISDSFPVEQSLNRMFFPRVGLYSQDQTEETKNPKTGKKEIKVITEAGTFYIENQLDTVNSETGKREWEKVEVGTEIEGIILYFRKQLKFYDGEFYTSSPIYDTDDETIPLFKDKKEVDRGTPAELKARAIYQGKTAAGKPTSKLEENKVLYILIGDKTYQTNIRGGSRYAFDHYKKLVMPPTVLTKIISEAKENGAIKWNQMVFNAVRSITAEEAELVENQIDNIRSNVMAEKAAYMDRSNVIESEEARTF